MNGAIVNPFPLIGRTFTGPSARIVPSRTPPVLSAQPLGGVHLPYAPDVPAPGSSTAPASTPSPTPPPSASDGCGCG